ncbi:MAG: carboxypeptidase-like regulatory domain-containing protein, partial [Ferruginibacter sp.]
MRRLITFMLIFTMMLAVPGWVYSQNKTKLSGIVMDSSRKPLHLVSVRFFQQNSLQAPLQTTLSNEDGAYQVNKVDSGTYILSFTHTGFNETKQTITVKPGADIQINPVILSKTSGT